MNALTLKVGVALATLLVTNAFAQSGESGAAGIVAVAVKGTPEQEAAGLVSRHGAARLAAQEAVRGETGASVPWVAVNMTPDQRSAAAAARRSDAAGVYRNGEPHGGETGR